MSETMREIELAQRAEGLSESVNSAERIFALRDALLRYENWFAEHSGELVPVEVGCIATEALREDDARSPEFRAWLLPARGGQT